MNGFISLLLFLTIIVSGYWIYQWYKKREEERRQRLEFFRKRLPTIRLANSQWKAFLNIATGYFSHYQWTTWRDQNKKLFEDIRWKSTTDIGLSTDEIKEITDLISNYDKREDIRIEFNKVFVAEELKLYSKFFDDIEGRKLDEQQRTAIVTDEDNNLIIAGAGSGKTTTIVGKVNYIIHRYKVKPEEILLISFTNKSASTLNTRVNIPGVTVKTFNKFGKDIIVASEKKQPSIYDVDQFDFFILKTLRELMVNSDFLKKVTDYFINFAKPIKPQSDFKTQGEYFQYLKDQNFNTYKTVKVRIRGHETLMRQVVKSIEECKIANFLFFNGVNYEYEAPYPIETASMDFRQYKPDFTIKQDKRIAYLEHCALDRNHNVPAWFAARDENQLQANSRYIQKMSWARELHIRHRTTLIETYSYQMSDGTLFSELTKKLNLAGIELKPKTPQEIWEVIQQNAKDEVDSFVILIATFITVMKSNNCSIEDVRTKNKNTKSDFLRKRHERFIDIVKPIYERYEKELRDRHEIDFSDMINKASRIIENNRHQGAFKYVIIDEFQDISIGRYQLVKAIKTVNPDCKLFCVGDDWQSIYRFTGSDIALFREFEKYFGYTVKSKIETTYRFGNPMIGMSSDFIQKNPNQEKKQLKAKSSTKATKYGIHYVIGNGEDDTETVLKIFDEIGASERIAEKEILILGRYKHDLDRIKNERRILNIDKKKETVTYGNITAQYMTVHKAKGLEADILIILNCNSGRHGFPSEMADDPVLNILLSASDHYENGEERRLFYVAMTRAKEQVHFVSNPAKMSKFIAELEAESDNNANKKCPKCRTSNLVLRAGTSQYGKPYRFYGCTNFAYGCDFTLQA